LEKIISFDGHEICFERTGTGRPLVLLHGLGMSAKVWQNQQAGLADFFSVMALDLRGHGRSTKDTTDFSIAAQAGDLRELLRQLDLKKVLLVGWSMGAAVAFRYLQDFAGEKRIEKLMLVGAGIDYRMAGKQQKEFQQWIDLLTPDNNDWPGLFAAGCLAGAQTPENRRLLERMVRDTGPAVIVESARCLARESFTGLIPEINLPVLICCGKHETQRAVRAAHQLAQTLPCARLIFFAKSGHSPFLQESKRFNREVINFGLKPF